MSNVTVSSTIDTFMQAANQSAAQTALGITTATSSASGLVPGLGGTSPGNAATIQLLGRQVSFNWAASTGSQTGSGSQNIGGGLSVVNVQTGTTAGSTAYRSLSNGTTALQWGVASPSLSGIDTSKPFLWRASVRVISTTTNGVFRLGWGKTDAGAVGAWTTAGFGFEIRGTRLWFFRHNGTALTQTDTGQNVSAGEQVSALTVIRTTSAFLIYLNGTLVLTDALSAVGSFTTLNQCQVRAEVENGADAAQHRVNIGVMTFVDLQ